MKQTIAWLIYRIDTGEEFVTLDDPKDPDERKCFSHATIQGGYSSSMLLNKPEKFIFTELVAR